MKKEITLLAISMFLATGINAQQELTVTHTTAGAMEAEINAALGTTGAEEIQTLIINGDANVTYEDCSAIAAKFPTISLKKLDLGTAKFENDSTPGNKEGASTGAFDIKGNGMQVEEVVLPAGLKVIGPRTFRKFSKMKKINLPNTLVKLGEGCFTGCGSLDLEKLPEGLKTIEGYVFYQAYAMKSLEELPAGLEGVLGALSFAQTSVAISYIPEGITEIGSSAFNANTRPVSLTSLTMYEKLAKIGSNAFKNQKMLNDIELNRMTPPETTEDAFTGIELGKEILYIPKGSRAAYEAVAPWNQMDIYDVLEPPTGIENTEITAIGIYPNPVVNTISISVQDAAMIKSIKIIDLAGTVVKNLHPEGTLTFDVSDLVNGMYFLQLNDDTTVKFIKK